VSQQPPTNPGQSPGETIEQRTRQGIIAGLAAYLMWGLFPIYFKVMSDVSALEMLAHRIVWSLPFGALIIWTRHQWPEVKRALIHRRTLGFLLMSALVITVNWLTYIYAVQSGNIFQASLGYYINPLMYVIVGVLFFGEHLRRAQVIAVVLAAAGVAVLTVSGGEFPVVSIILGISFTCYGVIRKQVVVGGMPGLFIEVLVLSPIAAIYLLWLMHAGQSVFVLERPEMIIGLLLAGPLTVLPLLAFALAARRLELSAIGFLQYIAPTMQFCVGLAYGEKFTVAHAICFGLIWLAVAVFGFDAWRAGRQLRGLRRARQAGEIA
jgi:chloramphenicol-sensitive protein RarD